MARTHAIHTIGPQTHVLVRFLSVWLHLSVFRYYMKLSPKRVELVQLMHKFVPQSRIVIFRKERTRSNPLEPNSCSGAFRSVLVHLAMFRYYTELGAKWVELVN